MNDYYTQFSPPRPLRKVKRLPLLPAARLPNLSGQDEPLNPRPGIISRDMSDQNDDTQKRQQAFQDLVTIWQERLQLMSAIATFFASTESSLYSIASRETPMTLVVRVTNAAFLGAMIIHVFVAFVSFMASFLLVNYRIHETEVEIPRGIPTSGGRVTEKSEKHHRSNSSKNPQVQDLPPSSNPRLVQVGLFKGKPPVHLLGRCHSLCVTLASFAFILAFIGVCCFAWTISDPAISVFATVCIGLCLFLCIWVFILYDANSIVIKVDVSIT